MPRSAHGQAMHGLMRACYDAGNDLAALRIQVLHELARLVAFDAAFLAASDPETLLFTAAFADDALVDAGPRFLDNEFGACADVNRFAALAVASDPVASLDNSTKGEWNASPRWREIMAPLGMGDEARVALRVDDTTWGFLCLHRSGPLGFDHRELGVLRSVGPHIGEAIRRTVAEAGRESRTAGVTDPGLIIVVNDHVEALGGSAAHWLECLGHPASSIGDPLPLPLLAVARRLEQLERSDPGAQPAASRLRGRDGTLVVVHASRLHDAHGAGPIALAVAPIGGAQRASFLLAAYGLTPAQRRVAHLVLQGRTTRQIMLQLRIGEHTVQDHLKVVFDKTGVRSRRDLVAAVMHPGT